MVCLPYLIGIVNVYLLKRMRFVLNLQMLRRVGLRIRFVLNLPFLNKQLVYTFRIPRIQWIVGVVFLVLRAPYLLEKRGGIHGLILLEKGEGTSLEVKEWVWKNFSTIFLS